MRFSFLNFFLVGMVCLFAAISCKDSSTDSPEEPSANGLWKLNSTEGDVAYINVTTSIVTFFDFMGDDYDEGEDCYEIEVNDIIEINGNTYTFEDPFDPEATIDVEVTVDEDQLTVKQPFGDAVVTLTYTRFDGNSNTFNPECEEESTQSKQRLLIN